MAKTHAALISFAVISAFCVSSGNADDLRSKIINAPNVVKAWGTKAEWRSDKGVEGGCALRITTSGEEKNLYDVGVYSPIDKPVKSGDRLVLAFWARAEQGPDGTSKATLPMNAIQLATPPFTSVVKGSVDITGKWEIYQVGGRSDKDYAVGTIDVGMQLAAGKQVVDIGPVFVYDLGQ